MPLVPFFAYRKLQFLPEAGDRAFLAIHQCSLDEP
jgi:hypothetical protein